MPDKFFYVLDSVVENIEEGLHSDLKILRETYNMPALCWVHAVSLPSFKIVIIERNLKSSSIGISWSSDFCVQVKSQEHLNKNFIKMVKDPTLAVESVEATKDTILGKAVRRILNGKLYEANEKVLSSRL